MRWLMVFVLLAACEKAEAPAPPVDPLHGVELPDVAGPGYGSAARDPEILVTTRAIIVDGVTLVSLTNGRVAPEEKDGGERGLKINRLAAAGAKLAENHVAPPLLLALDRHVTYRVLIESLFSLKQQASGWKDFRLVAKAKGATVMVPIHLPEQAPPVSIGYGPPSSEAAPVSLVVTSTGDKMFVWSLSGTEGTLQAPKTTIPWSDPTALTKLSTTLAEIVHRRWPGQRPDDRRTIVVMPAGNTSIQTVAGILGAVRAAADGSVLFPDVLLSNGFE